MRPFQRILHSAAGRTALGAAALACWLAAPVRLPAALIGYWNFDEGSGTTAADTSGRTTPLNGTLSGSGGGPVPQWITGRFGNALNFNFNTLSAGGLVTVPFNPDLRLSNAFSISFWWRPDYVPAASTFPGIVRIGSQSAVPPAANAGWGFFRTQPNTARFKRGNNQPDSWRPAMTVGQWHHVAITYDGAGNNIAYVNGNTATFVTNWPGLTTSAALEFGRMDAFDDAGLDDAALFNEGLGLARMRSVYTVPANLQLDYNIASMRSLWSIFDAGPGSSGTVKGTLWTYTTSLPGSTAAGDAYLNGNKWYVVLGTGAGLTATAQLLGDISPAGAGSPGTMVLPETPQIGASARFVMDLNTTTTVGGGVNDLIDITGDLNLLNNTVVINPLGNLVAGTYRLINYTGSKSGSLNPVVVGNSRYTLTIDESTPGQINLVVSGTAGEVRWVSTSSGNWDLTSSNWVDVATSGSSRFFQGDSVTFNDAGAYQAAVTLGTPVYPAAMTVDSATLNYSFTGTPLGGLAGGLTKSGPSLLTLSAANNFIGPVNLNGGMLRIGNSAALGSTNSGTAIGGGTTLDLAGVSPGNEPFSIQGAGLSGTGAVINTGAGLVNDGLRGVVTLAGDAVLGGANRFDIFGGRLFGSGFKLTKIGAAEIALSNLGDTGLGEIDISRGQLTILGSTTMGNPAAAATVRSGATLAHWASGAMVHDKPLVLDSGRLINGTTGGSDVATNIAAVSLTGTNTVEGGSSIALLGTVSGTGALVKNGAGTLRLEGANTYSGAITVNAGTLAVSRDGTIPNASPIALLPGTRLNSVARTDGTLTLNENQWLVGSGIVEGGLATVADAVIAPGFSAGTLTVTGGLNLTGGTRLVYELGGATTPGGGINDLITVGGGLNLSGVTTVRILPAGQLVTGSPYTLISYSGSLVGDASNFSVESDTRITYEISTATPGAVTLTASGSAASLTWQGGATGAEKLWDVKNTPNWLAAGSPETFYPGDAVSFTDSAAEFEVELVGELYAGAMSIEAEERDYLFTGAGRLRGGTLTKSGAGRLILANTGLNDYPGQTVINAGTIQLGNGDTSGSLGPNSVVDNGTLTIARSDNFTLVNAVSGTGTLRKDGANVLSVGTSLGGFDGNIVVAGGVLRPTAAAGLGTVVGGTQVTDGGTLDANGLNYGLEAVTIEGAGSDGNGALVNTGAAQTQAFRSVTLANDSVIGGTARFDVRNPGAGATFNGNELNLVKKGPNQVSLVGVGDANLVALEIQQGTISAELNTSLGGAAGDVTVQTGATMMFWSNTVPQAKTIVLNNGGRLFKDNGTVTLNGGLSLSGSNIVEAASNNGTEILVNGPVGGEGFLNKAGAGSLVLTADGTFAGSTVVNAGNLFFGNGGTAGWIPGNVHVVGALYFHRFDVLTLANNITGPGTLALRTTNGLILDGTAQINMAGNIEVGRDVYGKMIVQDGANVVAGRVMLGNIANTPGEVVQSGGNVWIGLEARIGHWPTETSTYLLGGGNLNLTNTPAGVVNQAGAAEQNGILYLGIDGTGIFTQTGGVARMHGLVLDGRGNTAGTDTFNLEGGTLMLGASGFKSGSLDANTSYQINLGGGTIASSVNWTSTLAMTLTGTRGDVTFDLGGTVRLNGLLSGPGGLRKAGGGTLVISRTNLFAGTTLVDGGTLTGAGTYLGPVAVTADGTLAPGLGLGVLSVSNTLTLGGNIVMEINKSGATLTSDLVAGVSTLTYGGKLTVVATGDALINGAVFNLFDAASFAGSFSSTSLPTLPAGLFWDLSQLVVDGTIRVLSRPTMARPVYAGGSLTVAGTGGTPNVAYRIVASDDITAPVSLWIPVASGTFDAAGAFSSVLAVGAERYRFYSVTVP